MIVECFTEHGCPRAIELDTQNRAYGWVYYQHVDGHWVTLRKASEGEIQRAKLYVSMFGYSDQNRGEQ